MGFQNNVIDSKYNKHILSLKKPATRAKSLLKDAFQKSQKRFLDQADKLEMGNEKNRILKKLHKVKEDLQILENLSEDDIIELALTTNKRVMAIASNPRLPKELRMKARVASHKPLSSHLARVKSLVEAASDQSENEEEAEAADDAGERLDRLTINNQIVKMRGAIKQAKVHLIHKFTRNVRLLQRKKGTEEMKAKQQRKAERFVKRIQYIKDVEADDVSKFALSTETEDVKKILLDVKMPMKSQVMAIITNHKAVAASIEDFRKTFPDWSTTVQSLLKKKSKKRKLKVEVESNVHKKLRKDSMIVQHSDGEISNEEHENSDVENDGRSVISNSDNEEGSCVSEDEDNDENNSKGVCESSKVEDSGKDSDKSKEDDSEMEEETENKFSSEGKSSEMEEETENKFSSEGEDSEIEEETENKPGSEGESSEMEEETENNLESENEKDEVLSSNKEEFQSDSEDDIENPIVRKSPLKSLKRHLDPPKLQPANKKTLKTESQKKSNVVVKRTTEDKESGKHSLLQKPDKPRVVKEKPKVVDPFFMTTTNEEYLTSQVPSASDDKDSKWNAESNDYKQKNFDKFGKFNSKNKWSNREDDWKQSKFSNRGFQHNQKPSAQSSQKPSFNNSSEPFNIFANRKERRKALHQPPQEAKVEKLHPSWEAKKKQTSIASFQGKKVVFD